MRVRKIKAHFKKSDPVIFGVIDKVKITPLELMEKPSGYFKKLCREIISQQLAGKAARAIVGRFNKLFDGGKINPEKVLSISEQTFRDVGMSWAKARYVRDLALKVKEKEVRLSNLHDLENHLVIEELVKVKGIGNWTAEMFLIFTLGREDVFSHGDLGLRKGLQKLYGFKDKPSERQTNKIVEKWGPYKSYGCFALWESVDSND
ncbi:MAG: DNA-3-methyladenine glycosylase 2 family protein [Candidatus Pacebacteria bacterium]|nr:DNA-3-methyladenine glycosylase 2 family protein [Candidatus Paceibacterota bacterium]